jgi:hypothetical protein
MQSICVEAGERVCLNCERYRLYYRKGEGGGKWVWIPTNTGFCLEHSRQRGLLMPPCRDFEKME